MEESQHAFLNKRLKTPPRCPSPPPGGKGKAKTMEECAPGEDGAGEGTAADGRTCGICFTEEGRSIRGWIDSCDHYFCFVCVMEWAKIESRCPLCKQRFGCIRRPPVQGVFFCERVVHVPVRDQVHQLYGNGIGEGDPYSDVTCSACHGSSDENLLLLCDLCDSAAHAYCAGLGFTVPEGDWYCHDCTILRNEQSKMRDENYGSNEHFHATSRTKIEDDSPVSISEIIHDEVPFNSFSGSRVLLPGTGTNDDERATRSGFTPVRESTHSFPKTKLAELGARTLHQCRNLHLRIRLLRENWFALQNGSLDFKSTLDSTHRTSTSNSRKHSSKEVIPSISRQRDHHSSADNKEAPVESRVTSEMHNHMNSSDVTKAWKMLEIAKSKQKAKTGAKSSHQFPKLHGKKNIYGNKFLEHRVHQSIPDRQFPGCPGGRNLLENRTHEKRLFDWTGSENCLSQTSYRTVEEKCKIQYVDKQRSYNLAMKELGYYSNEFSPSTRKKLKSSQDLCHEIGLASDIYDASRSVRLKDVSACSGSSNRTESGTCGPLASKKELPERVGSMILPSYVKSVLQKDANRSSTRICDGAKSEIQSLVKLNLKLQCRGRHLETQKFKEVARVATHTILAACGLDHSKPNSQPCSGPVCRHSDEAKLRCRSNLMPDSCRECFFSFVKDVVDGVVTEKATVSNSD